MLRVIEYFAPSHSRSLNMTGNCTIR